MVLLSQTEKLFEFFDLNFSKTNLLSLNTICERYLKDYNLLSCFFKDYLTLQNNYVVCKDSDIYNEFVDLYDKKLNTIGQDEFVADICKFAKYYLVLIFEKKFEFGMIDNEILGYIETINLFYVLELYPYLLEKIDKFLNLKIDRNVFCKMLKSLVDIVVQRDIDSNREKIDLILLDYEINKIMLHKDNLSGRLVG